MAGLIMLPFMVVWLVMIFDSTPDPPRTSLELYHHGYGQIALPILALICAPLCLREDLEPRTIPLLLVRPSPVWALPFGKGLLWFAWCAAWFGFAVALMPLVGLDTSAVPRKMLALLLTFWAMLGFASLLVWFFKRGMLWAALFLFIWELSLENLPPALQRATFTHYLENIAGSQHKNFNALTILSQTQATTSIWLSAALLIALGLLAWGIIGLRLQRTPVGLAGDSGEG
jgi:hypothetical protein